MVAPTFAMPNIGNLSIGRGFLQCKFEGETSFHDMGNVAMAEFLCKPTLLPHFSTRIGIRKKDLVVVTELEATLTMSLEELTVRNMAIAMLGDDLESAAGTIHMFAKALFYGHLKFTGTNDVGAKWNFDFPLCLLSPSKAVSLITQGAGSWATIDLQADVLQDPTTGEFCIANSTSFQ